MRSPRSASHGVGRFRLLLVGFAAAAIVVVVAACGGGGSSSSSSSTEAGGSETAPSSEGGGKQEGFKVALLTPGTKNDGSWAEAVNEGAEEGAAKYGAELQFIGNIEESSAFQQQGVALAQSGYNLIINAYGLVGPVTEELAKKFPDVKFGQLAAAFEPEIENAAAIIPEYPVSTFQAGVLAGLMTKTGTVGTIGGFEFPALTSEMEGFALGARWANPKVKILRTYINSWTDAGKAKAAAQAQASQGADVVFSATDQATQGMYQVAETGGTLKYVIPQYLDKSEEAPTVVLASVVYGLQGAVASFIEMYGNEEWNSANVEYGIEDGVDLAPNPAMKSVIPKEVAERLEEVEAKIASGKLKIPSIEELSESESAEGVDLKSLEG
jgi:basic membrane lipoprotein Med (substrate-binding protein (PBP1-ABC) superfamily)